MFTCSTAKDNAEEVRYNEAVSNYSKYCNCSKGSWSATCWIKTNCGGSIYSVMTDASWTLNYENPCNTSKSMTVSWTCNRSTNTGGGQTSGSFNVIIPTGSGTKTGTNSLNGVECQCFSFTSGDSSNYDTHASGNC